MNMNANTHIEGILGFYFLCFTSVYLEYVHIWVDVTDYYNCYMMTDKVKCIYLIFNSQGLLYNIIRRATKRLCHEE